MNTNEHFAPDYLNVITLNEEKRSEDAHFRYKLSRYGRVVIMGTEHCRRCDLSKRSTSNELE
jgi:hypothetical protein